MGFNISPPLIPTQASAVRKFIKNENVKQQLWSIFSHGDVKKLSYCCPFHSHVDRIYCGKSTPTSRNQIRKGRKYHFQTRERLYVGGNFFLLSVQPFFRDNFIFFSRFYRRNLARIFELNAFRRSSSPTWTFLSLSLFPYLVCFSRSYDAIKERKRRHPRSAKKRKIHNFLLTFLLFGRNFLWIFCSL